MRSDDKEEGSLMEDQIADNIIGVPFAAQDTTASILTWILKYLHDHPKLLEAVKAEQKAIYEMNGGSKPLSWSQTRNMPVTSRVGCIGEFENGKHHIIHIQRSRRRCGIPRLDQDPIPLCHLAMEYIHVQGMNLQRWKFLYYSTT